ncbi:hypothetical protein ACQJBY_012975 [Aegilops geniculata]
MMRGNNKRRGKVAPPRINNATCSITPRTPPSLPEDIWCHIHSLMPMRAAARVACVSRLFRESWSSYPNLTFSSEALGKDKKSYGRKTSGEFTRQFDHIMRNHSGIGMRTLKLLFVPTSNEYECSCVDKWLRMAVTRGIQELALVPRPGDDEYEFSLSLLTKGKGDSLRHLHLEDCFICPTVEPCCLRSLTILDLTSVHVTGDELWCLLSGSSALERFELKYCDNPVCLKIPRHLQRLSHVKVQGCSELQVIESKAPKLSRFEFVGELLQVQISLGETLQVRNLRITCDDFDCSTQAELASSMPSREMINSPMASSKLVNLKSVSFVLGKVPFCRSFDCSSLFPLFGASLTLETFISHVFNELMHHALVFGDPTRLSRFNTTGVVSPEKKTRVEEACHMLRAWLS